VTRIPLSTYRLQFNSRFTFRDAGAIVEYLHALGISDCYASSYLTAVPGSPHGYDVADPTRLNPDIGSEEDYGAWIEALRSRDMGQILDVVPNHMGIAKSANPWWVDVLENGPCSRFARFFDIEWRPVKDELADKVLIPILGDQYGAALERQELQVAYRDGAFVIRYYDETIPIAPDTYPSIVAPELDEWIASHAGEDADELQSILTAAANLPARSSREADAIATRAREKEIVKRRLASLAAQHPPIASLITRAVRHINGIADRPRSFDRLDQLLNAQSYRLAHWRVASEEINYRRFFDVNQLAALRMEDPVVFDEVHRFIFDLVRSGAVTGLRIDHVDGLFEPASYLRRLQETLGDGPAFIVVEKILGQGEHLPCDWPVSGTTGYEFAAVVNNLFVDRRNEKAIDDIYRRFVRDRRDHGSFADLAYRSKKQILHETMSGDINSLGHQLNRFSERNRHFRDFTLYSLISTIKEIIACFPVYRSYVTADDAVSDHDRRYITDAVRCAKRRAPGVTPMVFDFIAQILLKQTKLSTSEECAERARFIGKFQQITSPVAAKGIEDTALYLYNRLVSLNEVGGDPTVFGLEPSAVHDWMIERRRRWPSALSATSTHDTKRGEDARARLDVLSEIPGAWKTAIARWRSVNRKFKSDFNNGSRRLAPDSNEEYLIYQTLLCAWPFAFESAQDESSFRDRIATFIVKAMREAKVHSSWLNPDDQYEQAVLRFTAALLDKKRAAGFLQSFLPFHARVAELGIYNSLAQLAIKMTAPGVPDFYRGTEFWDLNLVDPDNRRPVDFDARKRALAQTADVGELLEHRADGRVKMFVMRKGLEARAALRDVFEQGEYAPLQASGARKDCVFAFARGQFDGDASPIAITCVPRLIASLVPDAAGPPLGQAVWSDTRIAVPSGAPLRNVFTGDTATPARTGDVWTVSVAALFERFPVAVLCSI